ncbi:hypothetical protein WJ972_04245 [Achromobacter insuavis]
MHATPRFTLAPLTLALWLALAGPAQAQPAAPDARIQATLPAQPLGQRSTRWRARRVWT